MSRPKGSKNKPKKLPIVHTGTATQTIVETAVAHAVKYVATLHIMGRRYSAEGETGMMAIESLRPAITKGRSVLVLEHDGKKIEKVLMPMITMRLFGQGSPTMKLMAMKWVKNVFGI